MYCREVFDSSQNVRSVRSGSIGRLNNNEDVAVDNEVACTLSYGVGVNEVVEHYALELTTGSDNRWVVGCSSEEIADDNVVIFIERNLVDFEFCIEVAVFNQVANKSGSIGQEVRLAGIVEYFTKTI